LWKKKSILVVAYKFTRSKTCVSKQIFHYKLVVWLYKNPISWCKANVYQLNYFIRKCISYLNFQFLNNKKKIDKKKLRGSIKSKSFHVIIITFFFFKYRNHNNILVVLFLDPSFLKKQFLQNITYHITIGVCSGSIQRFSMSMSENEEHVDYTDIEPSAAARRRLRDRSKVRACVTFKF